MSVSAFSRTATKACPSKGATRIFIPTSASPAPKKTGLISTARERTARGAASSGPERSSPKAVKSGTTLSPFEPGGPPPTAAKA